MKVFVVLNLLFLLGLSLALPTNEAEIGNGLVNAIAGRITEAMIWPKRALRRFIVKNTFEEGGNLDELGPQIIQSCSNNGYSTYVLQEAFDDLKTCLSEKVVILTPKDQYLNHIDQCAEKSIKITKTCLPENEKYLPDVLLELAKSLIRFFYDDLHLFYNEEVSTCISSLEYNYYAQKYYARCLNLVEQEQEKTISSKEDFCQSLRPASRCFPKMLERYCVESDSLRDFIDDYYYAMETPCHEIYYYGY